MMNKRLYAHSANKEGVWQDLPSHLKSVARLAEGFAEKIGSKELGHWTGLWHDVGKCHPDFQDWLANPEGKKKIIDHSSAGAVFASS